MYNHNHNYLRPPIEFYSGFIYFLLAYFVYLNNTLFYLPDFAMWLLLSIFSIVGIYRLYQGWFAFIYPLHLLFPKTQILNIHKLKSGRQDGSIFVARGFTWGDEHQQRLADMRSATGSVYLRKFQKKLYFSFMAKLFFGVANIKKVSYIGKVELAGVGAFDKKLDFYLSDNDRAGHTAVFGTTGTGKTRLMELLVTQDILNDKCVIVVDPKGDFDLILRMYEVATLAGKQDQFNAIHLGFPSESARYNPISSYSRITEVANRITSQLPKDGQSRAFTEFVWRYINMLAQIFERLGEEISYNSLLENSTSVDDLLIRYIKYHLAENGIDSSTFANQTKELISRMRDKEDTAISRGREGMGHSDQSWAAVKLYKYSVAANRNKRLPSDPVCDAAIKTWEYDKTYYDKLTASLYPMLEKVSTGLLKSLLSPNINDDSDKRPIINMRDVIRTNGILYIGMDTLTDQTVGGAVGNSFLDDLTSIAGEIYKVGTNFGLPTESEEDNKRTICLHVDEVNEVMGDSFIPLLNKGRGAGVRATIYTQTVSDLTVRLDNKEAKTEQALGNVNTLIMLRVRNDKTAEVLTKKAGDVTISNLTTVSAATDNVSLDSDHSYTSKIEDRITTEKIPLISTGDITSLPIGQCFIESKGSIYKAIIPLLDDPKVAIKDQRELLRIINNID